MATDVVSALSTSPNPSSEQVTVQFSVSQVADIHLTIVDMQGTVVHTESLSHVMPGQTTMRWQPSQHLKGAFSVMLTASAGNKVQRIQTKTILLR